MSRFFKLFTLPFFVFVIGVGIYFCVLYIMSSGAPSKKYKEPNISIEQKAILSEVIEKKAEKQEEKKEQNLTTELNATNVIAILEEKNETNTTPIQEVNVTETPKYINCYMVNAKDLNVRKNPSIESEILGKVYEGDIVCSYEMKQGWIRSDLGWIYTGKLFMIDIKDADKALKNFR